jgi:hypothetical protein
MNRESVCVCVHCYWRTKNIKYSKIYLRDIIIQGQSMWNLWWITWHWGSFILCASVFTCWYLCTSASYLFVHLSPILYNLSSWQDRKITHFTLGLTVRYKFVCFGVQVLILCLVMQAVLMAHKHKLEIMCIKTNSMHCLFLVYWIKIPFLVLGISSPSSGGKVYVCG